MENFTSIPQGIIDELEGLLRGHEAFLNITYEPGRDYHSITVLYDGSRFLSRDTNRKGLRAIPGLRKIGKLRDSVLYIRKSKSLIHANNR